MTIVTNGNTSTYTFNAGESLSFTLDPSERVRVGVTSASGFVKYGSTLVNSEIIGPFSLGDVASITAVIGDIDYVALSGNASAVPSLVTTDQSSSSANVSSLQAALSAASSGANGGRVSVTGGAQVYVNAPLTVGDNTDLISARGTTLKVADGAQVQVIQTSSQAAPFTSVAVAWTAGKTATVTWANHPFVKGDAMVLQGTSGTTATAWWDVYRVLAVVDANTFTIRLPFLPTAAPTGALTAKRCVRNLTIDINVDHNFTNNGGTGQNFGRMASIWSFIADSKIIVRGKDAFKYVALLAGALNVDIEVYGYPSTNSDTFKGYGPLRDIRVKGFGEAAEDAFSVQCLEPAGFIAYMPCQGNIRDVTFDGMNANQTTAGAAPFVAYVDTTYTSSNIVVVNSDMSCMAAANPAATIRPGVGYTPTAAMNKSLTFRNSEMSSSGDAAFNTNTYWGLLRFDGVRTPTPDADNLRIFKNTGTGDELIIENYTFEDTAWPVAGPGYIVENLGTIGTITFRNCRFSGSAFLRAVSCGGTSTTRQVVFDNCTGINFDVLCRVESTVTVAPEVIIRSGYYSGVLTIVDCRANMNVKLEGGPTIIGATNGIARCELTASVNLYDSGGTQISGGTLPFVLLNTATISLYTPFLPTDISPIGTAGSVAGVLKTAGSQALTTTLRGSIPAGRLAVCNGTNWVDATVQANTF